MVDEMLQAEPAGESATDDGADEWSLSAEQLTAEQAELGAAAAAPSDDAAERFGPVSDAAVAALSPGPASDAPAETTAEVPAIADFDAEDGGAAGEGKPSAELLDACDRALEAAAKVESARQVVERTADQMRGLAEQSTESQEAVRQLQADAEQRSRELYEEIARLRERFS